MKGSRPKARLVLGIQAGVVVLEVIYQCLGVSFKASLSIERAIVVVGLVYGLVLSLRRRSNKT